MTEKERTAIAEFRGQGYGYKKISQLTGINENSIKTYCKRNGLGGVASNRTDGSACKCCGATLEKIPGRKPKVFCNDQCRNRWWNSHLNLVQRKANYEFTCPTCGEKFTVYGNAHRKYCSHECYIEDRFGRRRYEG